MSFLQVSSREEYGLRLAIQLAATYYLNNPLSISEVAERENISAKYLEELIVPLKQAGLVKSISGRSGGYIFAKDPKTVTVRDVIWALDDNPSLAKCVHGQKYCPLAADCTAKDVWHIVQQEVEDTLSGVNLHQLIKT